MRNFTLLRSSFVLIACMYLYNVALGQVNPTPQSLPCLHITSQNSSNMNGTYSNENCILVGGEETQTNIIPNGNKQVNLRAGKEIEIESKTRIATQGNGRFHAKIETNPVKVVWYEPNSTPGFIGKHERLELGFKLPENITSQIDLFLANGTGGINPFDPDQIDFKVKFTRQNTSTVTRFAFYYVPFNENLVGNLDDPNLIQNEYVSDTTSFPWRIRFAPNATGLWNVDLEIIIPGYPTIIQSGASFVCVASNHKGPLHISNYDDERDRWMYYMDTGETFFAVGMNVASAGECGYLPSDNHRQLNGVQKLIDAGGNFTRFELGAQAALPDWDNYKNYSTKMDEMYGFDKLLTLCEQNGVYFTLFRHHVEMWIRETWATARWGNNPYKIGFNIQPIEYFTNETVISWQNKTLRYIYSRWGYSPNMVFYGYSEVDNWTLLLQKDSDQTQFSEQNGGDLTLEECVQIMYPWIQNQQIYIKENLNPIAKFCHSPARTKDMYDYFYLSDVVGLHLYGMEKDINFGDNFRFGEIEKYWKDFKKPIIVEEMGNLEPALYCCTGIEFHNSIWATAMMGDFGTGLDWWWDRGVMDFGYHEDLKSLQQFFNGENLRSEKFTPQKWDDVWFNVKNRKIENFALRSQNKERVLGWVHNATFYWRNLVVNNICVENLVYDGYLANGSCQVAQDIYGFPLNHNEGACIPRTYHEMYNIAVEQYLLDFDDHQKYKDNYTYNGGTQNLSGFTTFDIKNLKHSGPIKKHHYRIDFYKTHSNSLAPVIDFGIQFLHTNIWGRLKPKLPLSYTEQTADFAYKVTYLGHYKNIEQVEDTTYTTPPILDSNLIDFLIVYPNPNNGVFQIESSEAMQSICIYSSKGEKVFEASNVNDKMYKMNLYLEKGTYLIQIVTQKNRFLSKQIIVL